MNLTLSLLSLCLVYQIYFSLNQETSPTYEKSIFILFQKEDKGTSILWEHTHKKNYVHFILKQGWGWGNFDFQEEKY